MSRKNDKLPDKILIIPNADKEFHEVVDQTNLANMPHPNRIAFIANPNSGKPLAIKNVLLRSFPPYERIIVFHADPTSEEYNDIDAEYIDYIPEVDYWDRTKKNLFILEDINFKRLKADQKMLVDRYYGSFSTHHSISVWSTFQRAFSCPPEIRDYCNILFLWNTRNVNSLSALSSRLGINADDLKYIFKNICSSKYDFLVIDSTRPDKYLRKNIFTVIEYSI